MLFETKDRPAVCASLQPSDEMCGNTEKEAYHYLQQLEKETAVPDKLNR